MFYKQRDMKTEPIGVQQSFTIPTPFGEGFVQDMRHPGSERLAMLTFRKPVINGKQYFDVDMLLSRRDYPNPDVPSVSLWHTDDSSLTEAALLKIHRWLDANAGTFNVFRAPLPAVEVQTMRQRHAIAKVLAGIARLTDQGIPDEDIDFALSEALASRRLSAASYKDIWLAN